MMLLSISSCWINRTRQAPIEMRNAISRSRATAQATRRFATFEQATNNTRPAIIATVHKGRSQSVCKLVGLALGDLSSNAGSRTVGTFDLVGPSTETRSDDPHGN